MARLELVPPPPIPEEPPIVCPICWDHAVERIDGIVLTARAMGGRDLSQVKIYRCSAWHLFALFQQPKAWEV